jgi:hypothetical protein
MAYSADLGLRLPQLYRLEKQVRYYNLSFTVGAASGQRFNTNIPDRTRLSERTLYLFSNSLLSQYSG